ncbi:MAG: hypothetical protein HOP37_02855 [Cyclobacteriaceae bacterium]|nr:hypothetical protein [Cyclobacteriaceae bacterium]
MRTLELEKMNVAELSLAEAGKTEGGGIPELYYLAKALAAVLDYFYPKPAGPSPWAGCEEPPY